MAIRRLMVTTDFSEGAKAGVERGMAICAKNGADLVVLHVTGAAPNMATVADEVLSGANKLARMHELRLARGQELLTETVEVARSRGLQASSQLREGAAAETIAAVAKEVEADLVVMGARGLHGQQIFPIGSVTEGVVRRASTNVLVVRGQETPEFSRVWIATDLSDASKAVVHNAFDLASADADFELVHVVDWGFDPPAVQGPSGSPKDNFSALWEGTLAESRKELDTLVKRAGETGSTMRYVVVEGVAATEILKRVTQSDDHLLVVGKHAVAPLGHDSVAERVVRQAPCSVLVARRPL